MESSDSRRIEIFAPFSAALDLTKLILFQPFDLAKWFTIGFAAFLAYLGNSGGSSYNFRQGFKNGDWNWKMHSFSQDPLGSSSGMPGWLLPVLLGGGLVVFLLVVAVMWVSARGKFIFTDCIVRNRGAIAEPWREFRKEGNSLFLFSLLALVAWFLLVGLASIPLWSSFVFRGVPPEGIGLFVGVGLLAIALIITGIFFNVIMLFMVPAMYRRRCGALEGFNAALAATAAHPGPVILYLLFRVVLWVGVISISCVATCATCCIAAIPYLGTVILLPLYVLLSSYLLLFVRQFGNDFDVWANLLVPEPAVVPVEPPTMEPPPLQL